MAQVKKLLVVDADPETARLLAPPLRQRGYQVHAAHDGPRALQVAILRFPDLVLLDERTPLLDPRTFIRILRTNPRTERIPVVLMGLAAEPERARLGTWLQKPLQLAEVLARVEAAFRRADAAKAAGESQDLEGNLAQLPLPDLLQILSVNRKSGRLVVEREGERAEVVLREGRIVDASLGPVVAEKALWRLLTRREGQFTFTPGTPPGPDRIDRRLDDLLLEGLRQSDELAALLPSLPPPSDRLELVEAAGARPAGLHPVTEQVVALLAEPRTFTEVLDRCRASDLEAARAVAALLERGFARRRAAAPPEAAVALLAPHELHALRARVVRGRSSGPQVVGKVVVAGGGPAELAAAQARFATVPGYRPSLEAEGEGAGGGFGTLGRLVLGDGVRIDLVALPAAPADRPLWRPFAAGAVGALVLLPAHGAGALLEELGKAQRLPLVVCGAEGASLPEAARGSPGGVAYEGSDPAEALRALLAGAAVRQATY